MSAFIVLPVIDAARSVECFDTIDEQVRPWVMVVDNTIGELTAPHGMWTIRPHRNLGVARSWNVAIAAARAVGAATMVLLSAQVKFGAAGGRDLLDIALHAAQPTIPGPTFWHSAIFPLNVLDVVGVFDENFFPAYYEDVDMIRRCALAGFSFDDQPTIDASGTGDGHGVDRLRHNFPNLLTINYDALADYWETKWGCHVADAANLDVGYRTPFNNGGPVSWWPAATIDELFVRYRIHGS